jgi:hypothetical protein
VIQLRRRELRVSMRFLESKLLHSVDSHVGPLLLDSPLRERDDFRERRGRGMLSWNGFLMANFFVGVLNDGEIDAIV